MRSSRIALIHATSLSIEPIHTAFNQFWPEAQVSNLLDDSLTGDLAVSGGVTHALKERFVALARYARSCGAQGILYTCSAFGVAIDAASDAVDVPVIKPNEALIDEAIAAGSRIGVLATFEASIPSFMSELEAAARARNVQLQTEVKAVPAALAALQEGRIQEHDRLIANAADKLGDCDAVLLSQFSMARAADRISGKIRARVFTSPRSAVLRLRKTIER